VRAEDEGVTGGGHGGQGSGYREQEDYVHTSRALSRTSSLSLALARSTPNCTLNK